MSKLMPWDEMPNLKLPDLSLEHGYDTKLEHFWIKLNGGSVDDRCRKYFEIEHWLESKNIPVTFFGTEMKYYFKKPSTLTMILLKWS